MEDKGAKYPRVPLPVDYHHYLLLPAEKSKNKNKNSKEFRKYGRKISYFKEDLKRLNPGGWVIGFIINYYLLVVVQEYISRIEQSDPSFGKTLIFNTEFIDAISFKDGKDRRIKEFSDDVVEHYMAPINPFLFVSKILVPVNIRNNHWILMEANFDENIIYYYDSLKSTDSLKKDEAYDTLTNLLLNFLVQTAMYYGMYEYYVNSNWRRQPGWNEVLQKNSVDCGVFASAIAFYRALNLQRDGGEASPIQENIPMIREQMLYACKENQLSGMVVPEQTHKCIKLAPQLRSASNGSGALDIVNRDTFKYLCRYIGALYDRRQISFLLWCGGGGLAELLNVVAYFQSIRHVNIPAIALELLPGIEAVANALKIRKIFPEVDLSRVLYGMGMNMHDFPFDQGNSWNEALFYSTACIAQKDYVALLFKALTNGIKHYIVPERWNISLDDAISGEWTEKIPSMFFTVNLSASEKSPSLAMQFFSISNDTLRNEILE